MNICVQIQRIGLGLCLILLGGTPAYGQAPLQKKGTLAPLSVDGRCALQRPLPLKPRPSPKGQGVRAKKGDVLVVLELKPRWIKVRLGDDEFFANAPRLRQLCKTIEAPEPRPEDVEADSPSESPPSMPEPPPPPAPLADSPKDPAVEPTATGTATPPAQAAEAPSPSSGTTPAESVDHSEPVQSEARAATTQEKLKIAVLDLSHSQALPADLVASLTSLVPQVLEQMGIFKAISNQDIRQMLALEETKQMLGCDDAVCLAEIGGALGADYMVSGSVTQVDDTRLLQLQLMSIRESRVEKRVSREYSGELKGLVDEVRVATRLLVRDIMTKNSGNLVLSVSEEGATIRIDGTIVGVSPVATLTLSGGTHTLSIEKEGFIVFTRDIDVAAKEDLSLTAVLVPSREFQEKYTKSARFTRTMSWTSIGIGAAAFVAAGVLYGTTIPKAEALRLDIDAYNANDVRSTAQAESLRERHQSIAMRDTMALVATGVGLVGLATGLVLYVVGDNPNHFDSATTEVSSNVSSRWQFDFSSQGVQLRGEF